MEPRRVSWHLLMPAEAASAGEDRVGGKAAGLARLSKLGAAVPPWQVVPVEAFVAHCAAAGLSDDALAPGSDADPEALARAVLATAPGPDLTRALQRALLALGPGPYAVRSSMVGEDSGSHSFAGQLESYLFRRDAADVADAVRRCWASALAPRVFAYRRRVGLTGPVRAGVVVQQMIDGDVSGVVFTAHPVSGRRDHTLVTAAWGLGEGIVSGLCDTDEFVWARSGGEVSASIAPDKHVAVRRAPDGASGTEERPVPAGHRGVRCLSQTQVAALAEECTRVADALGAPQDLEYTWAKGALYLLQARPITSLPAPEHTDGPHLVFDNSNIQESYCGVTTPLTFSFASRAYATVYAQTMRAIALPESVVEAHRTMLRNMLGLVRGRVYYNINNWYRGLLLLPSFRQNKSDMEAMMGLEDPVDFVEDRKLTFGEKLRKLPAALRALFTLLRQFRKLRRTVPEFLAHFEASYRKVDRRALEKASFSELMETLDLLDRELLDNWHVPIINDFYVMMATGRLRRLVAKSGVDEPGVLLIHLMGGEEGIESTEPTRFLLRLARDCRGDAALVRMLKDGAPLEALAAVRQHAPQTAQRIDEYVERYGDRVMGELKLETVTLREDPSFVIEVLRNYLDRPDLDPDRLARQEREQRAQAEERLRATLGFRGRRAVAKVLRNARTAVKHRENMRLARTRTFGLYRDVYRALGRCLHEAGKLADERDVFYLTVEEISAYHEGRSVTANVGALAALRKEEFAGYEKQELPHQFTTVGPVYHGNRYEGPKPREDLDPTGRMLRGIGCYPGVVESPVRVILSPRDELSVNGRILVTLRTDTGWAPLFPTTSGILVERGSTLSHSAVVARELGIPAVVGIPNLLATVQDGERVRMDGGRGLVERLDVEAGTEA